MLFGKMTRIKKMPFIVLAILVTNAVVTATVVHVMSTSCTCATRHLRIEARSDIPQMLSDADARLLSNLTSYLEQVSSRPRKRHFAA